jgi:hypothetical protein
MGQRWQESKAILTGQSINPGSTVYSNVLSAFNMADGGSDFQLPVLFQIAAGGTGAFTITEQCSFDGVTFFDPTNATSILQGVVLQGNLVATAAYLTYTPIAAPYIRFKVVSTPAATVSMSVLITGDRA